MLGSVAQMMFIHDPVSLGDTEEGKGTEIRAGRGVNLKGADRDRVQAQAMPRKGGRRRRRTQTGPGGWHAPGKQGELKLTGALGGGEAPVIIATAATDSMLTSAVIEAN